MKLITWSRIHSAFSGVTIILMIFSQFILHHTYVHIPVSISRSSEIFHLQVTHIFSPAASKIYHQVNEHFLQKFNIIVHNQNIPSVSEYLLDQLADSVQIPPFPLFSDLCTLRRILFWTPWKPVHLLCRMLCLFEEICLSHV